MDKTKLKGVAALIAAAVAVILAAFLCMSFPMAEVHAATTYGVSSEKDLVYHMAYAKEGDTIQLNASLRMDLTDADFVREMFGPKAEPNKDVYLDATTELPAQSQTLDLNGHTLTIITGYTRCFSLTGDVTLTITDSSEDGTGAIVGYSNGSLFYSETQASSLVLQDVAVKFTEYTEGGASITPTGAVIDTVGNVTLNNVTYTPAEGDPALIEDNAGAQVSYVANTAEELAAAVADSSYSTVMLGADITQNITVEAGRTLTLDLNGHTLTAAAADETAVVSNYGTLTIVNTDTANTGAIQSADGSTWYTVFNEGKMTIGAEGEGYGELEVKNNSASSPASLVENNYDCSAEDPATLTIVSGTFTASGACLNAVKNDGYGICTIYGGTFTNEAEGGAAVMSAGTMTIYDGTFVQESDAAISNVVRNTGVGSPVAIEGGSFTGELYNEGADGFAISGGTFDRTFSMTYLTDAVSVWFKDGDSAFIVAEEQPAGTTQAVAYIRGGVFYATLQDAINDVSNSFTKEISLAADAKESVSVPAGVEFDFRMSGYSLTSAKDSAPAMTVNGSVTWINEVTGTISGKSGVLVKEGGVAYIKQSTTITFTGETNLSVEAGGEATVENGIFNGAIVNNDGTIELSGGTYAQKPAEEWLASGYGVVEQGGAYTVGRLYAEIAYMQGGQQVTEDFTDWAAAMEKLAELEGTITVKLYRQIGSGSAEFVVNEGQTVTLDQNGKLFSANIKNNGTLTITGSTGSVPAEAAEKLVNNGTLKIEGGKFNITSLENTGDLTIYGGSFGKSRELIVSMFAYFAEGVVVSAASDGYVTVKEAAAEAEVVCGDDVAIPCGSLSVAQSYSRYFAGDDTVTISLLTDASIKYLTFMGSAAPWTIDLNGRTLTVTSNYGLTFGSYSMSNRSFTVMGGTIVLTTGASDKYAINVKYGATLALDDVNVEFAGTTPFADMINVADNGTLNIESGNYYGGITRTNGTITIAEGCVFEEDIKDILGDGLTQNESGMVVPEESANAVAMIKTAEKTAYYDTLQAAIDACGTDEATITLLQDIVNASTDVMNGEWKRDPSVAHKVTEATSEAYAYYEIVKGQKITLNLNGHKLDYRIAYEDSADTAVFYVGGQLTITGEGSMLATPATTSAGAFAFMYADAGSELTIESGSYISSEAVIVAPKATVNIFGGTFTAADASVENPVVYYIFGYGGKINIGQSGTEGPDFEAVTTTAQQNCSLMILGMYQTDVTIYSGSFGLTAYVAGYMNSEPVNLIVHGGSFNGSYYGNVFRYENRSDGTVEVKGGTFNGEVYSTKDNFISGGSFTEMPAYGYFAQGYKAVWNEETQMYVTEEGSWAASIDDAYYGTLADALAAAKAGDEVVLQSNVTVTETLTIDKSITLDLNGKTITTYTERISTVTVQGATNGQPIEVTITDTKGNGAIVDASDTISGTPISSAVAVYEAANVTFKNVSLQSKTYYALYMGGKVKAPSVQVSGSTFTGGWAGAAITGINDSEQPVKFIAEDSTFTGGWYGVSGHGESHYTYIELTNCTVTGTLGDTTSTNYKDLSLGLYHPQNGTLIIDGGKITGVASGIEMRAGSLTVKGDAVITATAENAAVGPNGSGNTVVGAAVAVSQHTTNLAIGIDLQSGTYNGVYALREADVADPGKGEPVTMSVSGGTYNGEIGSENVKNFITGGSFAVRPADKYFGEDFTAQYEGGYYVPVYSTALKEARIAAQTDVRAYAATLGFAWADIEAAAAEGSEEAKLVLKTYNAIAEAASTLAVAEAKEDAFAAVEAYDEAVAKAEADAAAAFESYKAEQLKELKALAADDVNTADVDESVVLPTATWFALNNAETQEEFDEYLANAKAEIEAIRSLRTEISGQTQQLADLADALTAMSEGLFGDTESGTKGAFAELLGDVQGAIKQAQNAIVNGTTGEDGATTSTSLASIQNYLAEKIKTTLDSINTALNDTTNGLKAIKDAITDLDVSDQLADEFEKVLAAIIKAQDAINGHTDTQLSDAITEINGNTATLVKGLREALIGENGTGGVLGTIAGYVDGLEDMLGDKDNGLAAIVANIEAAKNAIMGVTEENKDGVSLSEVLKAVNTADGVIDQVLAAVQGLTGKDGILTQIKSAVDGLTDLDIGGEFEDVLDAITNAQKAIMGATEESAGTSIAGAVTAITGVVNALTKEDGMVYAINETLKGLSEALTGTENNAFTALAKELKKAIIGTGDATLTEIASGVAGANKAIADVLAAVQGLADADNGIVAQVETELAEMLKKIETLTGALATSEQVKGIETGIDSAKTEIDKIVAAIGSLGTGEGNDLATQIGGIVSDIEAVQGAVSEIGTNLGVAVDIEETKTNAVADLEVWLNAYLDTLLGTTTDEAESGVVMLAVTLETEDGDLYGRLTQAYSEANAQLILKYYNQALTAIDNATSTTDVSTAVSTFRAQVASVDAAAQNTPSMTGVYVLLAIVLVVLIAASIVVILKNRKAAAAVAAEPAATAAAEEKPAEEAKPEAAEEAAEEGSETEESAEAEKPEAEEELAADDDDKEQVVIAANVRSFAEAYVELSDEQRELFNKVKEYALGKEGTSEAKLSSGVCVKLGSKQVVKLAVRRGNPVALFVLENEMLKDFRRGATTQAKLKVRATELVLREEADLETAYTMVDLSVDQIKKDAEAAKERRREQRRERRRQRLAEEAARQAEHDGSED